MDMDSALLGSVVTLGAWLLVKAVRWLTGKTATKLDDGLANMLEIALADPDKRAKLVSFLQALAK